MIFISFAPGDAGYAARIREALAGRFGTDQVFDFLDRLPGRSDVLLVVIGPEWIGDSGVSARTEVDIALGGTDHTVAVLVGGAPLPTVEDLPWSLHAIARSPSIALSDETWGRDISELAFLCEKAQPHREQTGAHDLSYAPIEVFAIQAASAGLEDAWRAGRAQPVPSPRQRAGDPVDCSVFAPPSAAPGDWLLVQVLAHMPDQALDAAALAQEFDPDATRRGFRSLETRVQRGERLMFDLDMPGASVRDAVQSLVWDGRPQPVEFSVVVADEITQRRLLGTVTVSLDTVPVGQLTFKVAIDRDAGFDEVEPTGDSAAHYTMAFVSYATPDRDKVLARVQMLETAGIGYFQDVLSIDPGQRWEDELYRNIDACDLFLLFWSRHARESKWVRKELNYALERAQRDGSARPAIRPVIIEGPPPPEPWEELAHLHFNDRLIYFMSR